MSCSGNRGCSPRLMSGYSLEVSFKQQGVVSFQQWELFGAKQGDFVTEAFFGPEGLSDPATGMGFAAPWRPVEHAPERLRGPLQVGTFP